MRMEYRSANSAETYSTDLNTAKSAAALAHVTEIRRVKMDYYHR